MGKIANQMTRVIGIGKLEKYEYDDEASFRIGKGILDINGIKTRFTIFNKDKEGVTNPHTKAKDFQNDFQPGDKVYITGSDNRSYSEAKDAYYEDIQVWDYRIGEADEIQRWVYVYVGDVKELTAEELVLSITDYKDNEMLYQISLEGARVPHGLEVGDRIKVKGTIFSGLVADFYGDGEFKTVRKAVEIKIENTKAEIEEDNKPENGGDGGLW